MNQGRLGEMVAGWVPGSNFKVSNLNGVLVGANCSQTGDLPFQCSGPAENGSIGVGSAKVCSEQEYASTLHRQ